MTRKVTFKWKSACVLLLATTASTSWAIETPVTPAPSSRTSGLLNWLGSMEGQAILSGQMEKDVDLFYNQPASDASKPFARIFSITGKYPAIRGFDLGRSCSEFTGDTTARSNQAALLLQDATTWYATNNGVVTLSWHLVMKHSDGIRKGVSSVNTANPDAVTDFDINKAVVPGTPEYARLIQQIDEAAVVLQNLSTAGVPVLFRPFHEGSDYGFWWGAKGPEPYKALWKILFNRLVVDKNLKNLIWVFTPGNRSMSDLQLWYPGDEYVDIIGLDKYVPRGDHRTFNQDYTWAKGFAGTNKLATLSESGPLPDVSQMQAQGAKWMSFMNWYGEFTDDPTEPNYNPSQPYNTDAYLQSVYSLAYVLTRDELPNLKTLSSNAAGTFSKLVFSRQPTHTSYGDAWQRPVYVAAVDSSGRITRGKTGTVNLYKGNTFLAGVPLVNGVARFNGKETAQLSALFSTISTGNQLKAYLGISSTPLSNTFNVGTASDTADEPFEVSTSGWNHAASPGVLTLSQSGDRANAGTKSLKLVFNVPASQNGGIAVYKLAPPATLTGGKTITFKVWVPRDVKLDTIVPYIQGGDTGWTWASGAVLGNDKLMPGAWNTLSVTVPTNAVVPLNAIGLVFGFSGAWSGNIYIDSVDW